MDRISEDLAVLIARRFATLAEPTRVRLLDAIHGRGEASVGELAEAIGAGHANVSKHLQLMLAERVLSRRRDGTRVMYRIADPTLIALCEQVCAGVRRSVVELSSIVDSHPNPMEAA